MKPGVDTISSYDAVKPQLATKKTAKNMIIRSVSVGLKRVAMLNRSTAGHDLPGLRRLPPKVLAVPWYHGTLILRLYSKSMSQRYVQRY